MCEKDQVLFESTGVLNYNPEQNNLRLLIDPGIVDFYRSLIPKWIDINRQKYSAHISVVRKEPVIPNLQLWGKYGGDEVIFQYSNIIYNNSDYFWVNAFSVRLEEIRTELGLSVIAKYVQPPTGFKWTFHISLANRKNRG